MDDKSRTHYVAHSPQDPKIIEGLELCFRTTQKEESSSCRCTTTSCGDSQNERVCLTNDIFVATYAKKCSSGHWSFLGSGSADRTRLYLELDLNRGSEFRTDLTNS